MIAIVDYGVGNLFSLKSSLDKIGVESIVTSDKETIKKADRIILPGVGAFSDAIKMLRETGLCELVIEEAKNKKPILGICLGMQLLFTKSYEYGEHSGLDLIKGEIVPMEGRLKKELKIPHIGWNSLKFTQNKSPIFKYINDGDFVYFVHSYFGDNCEAFVTSTAEYGIHITASVQDGNVFGCQFHPEKSGETGLKILKAFSEIEV